MWINGHPEALFYPLRVGHQIVAAISSPQRYFMTRNYIRNRRARHGFNVTGACYVLPYTQNTVYVSVVTRLF